MYWHSGHHLRLKTLLLCPDEDDNELSAMAAVNYAFSAHQLSKDASKRRRENNLRPIKQQESGTPSKIRSLKLYPSLILHELYDQAAADVRPSRMTTMITTICKVATPLVKDQGLRG